MKRLIVLIVGLLSLVSCSEDTITAEDMGYIKCRETKRLESLYLPDISISVDDIKASGNDEAILYTSWSFSITYECNETYYSIPNAFVIPVYISNIRYKRSKLVYDADYKRALSDFNIRVERLRRAWNIPKKELIK